MKRLLFIINFCTFKNKLLLVFTCNLCISGQQSDLFTLLVYFLVSASLQKKCTNINNGVILVPYNKNRLKQAISVMLKSLPFFHRVCNSVILTDAFSIMGNISSISPVFLHVHQRFPESENRYGCNSISTTFRRGS